jgi:hypothetical protein
MFSNLVGAYGAAAPSDAHGHAHGVGEGAHSHGAACDDAACGHAHGAPPARVVLATGDADGRCEASGWVGCCG